VGQFFTPFRRKRAGDRKDVWGRQPYPRIAERLRLDEEELTAILAALLSKAEVTSGRLRLPGVTRDPKDDSAPVCTESGLCGIICKAIEPTFPGNRKWGISMGSHRVPTLLIPFLLWPFSPCCPAGPLVDGGSNASKQYTFLAGVAIALLSLALMLRMGTPRPGLIKAPSPSR